MASAVQRARHEQRRVASIGYGFATALPPAGGGALLEGEANGFATDFTHAVDAERVALKTAGAVVYSPLSFFTSSGTSSKWVYNAAGVLVNIPVGTLALDYDPVTHAAKGLLCEPQATNLMTQSAMGRPGFVVGGNSASRTGGKSDPAGGLEAVEVVITAGEVGMGLNAGAPVTVTNGTTYTESSWCKGISGQKIYFNADVAATQVLVTFTGTWQRVSTLPLVGSGGVSYFGFETYNRSGGAHLPAVTFQAWGGQVEAGTVATSHIPTLAATVTRAADQVSVTPASINYSATVGSWWVEHYTLPLQISGWLVGQNNSGALFHAADHYYTLESNGSQLYKIIGGSGVTGNTNRVAAAFQSGDRALSAKGLAADFDAGATAELLTPVLIYFGSNASGGNLNGYIRKVRYLPRRPSNAELQTMTA